MANSNYRNLIENLYEGLLYIDMDRRIKYWSKGAEKITGYTSDEALDRSFSEDFICPTYTDGTECFGKNSFFSNTLENGSIKQFEIIIIHKDGQKIAISLRVAPMYDTNEKIVGATQLFTDNEEYLENLVNESNEYKNSFLDPLTKLPNKENIKMSIDYKLSEFRRYNRPFGVLLFEIDNFDKLSNIYGKEFDVQILIKISKILSKDLRPFDIAGRLSEKEFLIILVNVKEETVVTIGNRIKEIIENTEFQIGKGKVDISLSVGGIIASLIDSTDIILGKLRDSTQKCIHMGGNQFQIWSPIE
ncbi:MAG: diguanylate cyclase [Candidatus Tenebribacter davisii]|nr:diguanylate cyclase [Candidatus Tenebribacter davisii]